MSNNKVSTNPLLNAGNSLNFSSSPLFFPVQEQRPTTDTATDKSFEEGSFVGQSFTSVQETQNLSTINLFSPSTGATPTDPFDITYSAAQDQTVPLNSNVATSVQHEPQLFVPAESSTNKNITVSNSESVYQSNTSTPPFLGDSPQDSSRANPYSRSATSSHGLRPMYPSGNQFFQSPMQASNFQPSFQQPTPPSDVQRLEVSKSVLPPPMNTKTPALTSPPPTASFYQPVVPHWFYCKTGEHNSLWCPFSYEDSSKLELLYQTGLNEQATTDVISTDGGRYDVTLSQRVRNSIYWDEPPSTVRRCTWFYKGDNENHFTPYEETLSNQLEIEYQNVVKDGLWHKAIELGNKESVVVHNPQFIVHYQPDPFGGNFGSVYEKQQRSKTVKRGISATNHLMSIPPSETGTPDHLIFFCHGVGPVCDLRSRSIVECVDDFRAIQFSLLESHFKNALDRKEASRIEFLPVHWHRALHGDATGVDRNIRRLTLPSISRLRHFTNETLLDILFYSSPVYCQTIAETVGNEINFLYQRFVTRNPSFNGKVSLVGHSLGSLILFDLLCHQNDEDLPLNPPLPIPPSPKTTESSINVPVEAPTHKKPSSKTLTLEEAMAQLNLTSFQKLLEMEQIDMDTLLLCSEDDLKGVGLPLGPRKKLMAFLKDYESTLTKANDVEPVVPAAVVNPPKTELVYPSDSVENAPSLLSAATNVHVDFQQFDCGTGQPFVSYPKLDFEPLALFALGSPIGMFLTVRGISELGEDFAFPTCPNFINIFHPFDPVAYRVEPLINPDLIMKPVLVPHHKGRKRLHLELKESLGRMGQELKDGIMRSVRLAIGSMQKFAQSHWSQAAVEEEVKHATEEIMKEGQESSTETDDAASATSDSHLEDIGFGRLNGGRRIDYVLQERPLESFNDYLFAFQSHLCYWNSEDTTLLMMKESYASMGIHPDKKNLPSTS